MANSVTMRTVTEETPSEVAYLERPEPQRRVLPPLSRLESVALDSPQGPQGPQGPQSPRGHHLVFVEPPQRTQTHMDRRGWRRPSAPSIFHHFEALGRRLSGTAPATVTVLSPGGLAGLAPSPPALRRPSLAAVPAYKTVAERRPSALALMTHAPDPEEVRRLMDSPDLDRDGSSNSMTPLAERDEYLKSMPKFDDTITVYLSALYAKLLVTLGIAFPILETILHSDRKYYQGFYLYLYFGTFFFLTFMYGHALRTRALTFIVNTYRRKGSQARPSMGSIDVRGHDHKKHYGSFYLRLGAIAFGIGSMVYSGLEFGQFFEMKPECRLATQALTPAARMVLTLVQMQFIFLNNREMEMMRHKVVAQFGLMHMIATNLCEWLNVIIEETKHEIEHMAVDNATHGHGAERSAADLDSCIQSNILAKLLRNASPFLFPCTIEYSLICAVVLFEMWKHAHRDHGDHGDHGEHGDAPRRQDQQCMRWQHRDTHRPLARSANHLSVDCTKAHKGLFAGIILMVLTIISLILFFVLHEAPGFDGAGLLIVNVCELTTYVVTLAAVLGAFYQIRALKYLKGNSGLGLDNTLLIMAQTGVFMYNLFAVVAFSASGRMPRILVSEIIALVQAITQTIFVLDATRRRCCSARELRRKPGRQLVTFLLVANMSMWTVNTLEKSHARSRPTLLEFYGTWPWTLMVHISMPLAIFYRFHSTICLFEIWKSCYKLKHPPPPSRIHTDSERSRGSP